MAGYLIRDRDGIPFGWFSNKVDRDKALKHIDYGFPDQIGEEY